MQSGIIVPDNVREEFQALRMKRKHRYIIYKVNEAKDGVEVEKCGERGEDWNAFKESLPKDGPRYVHFS